MNGKRQFSDFATPVTAVLGLFMQMLALTLFLLFVLESDFLANAFISDLLRDQWVRGLGGEIRQSFSGPEITVPVSAPAILSMLICLLVNGLMLAMDKLPCGPSQRMDAPERLTRITFWTLPILVWSLCWMGTVFFPSMLALVAGTVNLALAWCLTGWMYEFLRGFTPESQKLTASRPTTDRRAWGIVIVSMVLFTSIFVAMNWALWFNLRIPHGDSVMYEEHLWNVTHGKGFRSYLDQGLFLGEHIQVIHLLLIPLYLLWPSHLLLELSETVALALGAIPTFLIARRHSGNTLAAVFLTMAYLFYFPLHYLDIAIDLKTFRPISFGVPLMLWGIQALEEKHWKQMMVAFLLALACKEDFAIVIAPLGLWCVWNEWLTTRADQRTWSPRTVIIGSSTAVLATVYLLFVVKYAIPWFRNWETVHYARYFAEFGETPTEIVWTMLTQPQLLFVELVTTGSIIYLLRLLIPVGMPLRGWSQLLVGLPVFVLLCLNNIAMQPPGPYHHFHAPIVPIVIWASCAAVAHSQPWTSNRRALWIFSASVTTSVLFSFYPLSLRFWDPGQQMYWRKLYVQDERAIQFENVLAQLPKNARVAATDYPHARLTHFRRSYDYSDYPRAVANYADKVPDDTEYIVIDRRHPYSIGVYDELSQLRELQREPAEWEVLPDRTNGYFAILKRRSTETD